MTNFECKYKSAEKSADIFEDRNTLIFCQVWNKKDTNFHIMKAGSKYKYHTMSFSLCSKLFSNNHQNFHRISKSRLSFYKGVMGAIKL